MKPWVLLLLGLAACPVPGPRRAPPELPPEPQEPFPRPPWEGAKLPSRPELWVGVKAPASIPYDPAALGVGGRYVSVRVRNLSRQPANVEGLHASFTATRDGVSFPCKEHVGGSPNMREPPTLDPGEEATFERPFDCTMPLPGRYDVKVFIRFAPSAPPDLAGEFTTQLVATNHRVPHPQPGHEGLYAIMTGGAVTRPLSPEAWRRGDYTVVIALINGGTQPVSLAPARVAFEVFKKDNPLPCSGAAEPLDVPKTLAPGMVHIVRAPVACAPSGEGQFEIVGHLALGGSASDGAEIGRLGLRVTREPTQYVPWP